MLRRALLPIVFLIVTALACAGPKKIIEFGWDEPNTAFMRKHAQEMDRTPFDGTVFTIQYETSGTKRDLIWDGWGPQAVSQAQVGQAAEDLRRTKLQRMRHNFARFNVTPGILDWWSDFSPVVNNARVTAWVARQGPCDGVLFDVEAYAAQLFDFRALPTSSTRTWDEHRARVHECGRQLMQGFQDGYPDLTVLLTFGYSLTWQQMGGAKGSAQNCQMGLLPALLDGMCEAIAGKARIVDGYETSYPFKDPIQFEVAMKQMRTDLLPIVHDPALYKRVVSFGFGIWMDYNSQQLTWDVNDVSKNHFTPQTFQQAVTNALQATDEYVWIYTEKPRWWTEQGKSVNLPEAYDLALRRARDGVTSRTRESQ